jgi:hypothetical protein
MGFGLPYGAVLTIACMLLALVHVFDVDARASRWVVPVAAVLSLNLPPGKAWAILSLLTQLAVSVFVLLRIAAGHSPFSNARRG